MAPEGQVRACSQPILNTPSGFHHQKRTLPHFGGLDVPNQGVCRVMLLLKAQGEDLSPASSHFGGGGLPGIPGRITPVCLFWLPSFSELNRKQGARRVEVQVWKMGEKL